MKKIGLFLFKLFIFWWLFFLLGRILFIIQFNDAIDGSFGDAFLIPIMSLRLDISAWAYLVGLPFLLFLPVLLISNVRLVKLWVGFLKVLQWILIIAMSMVIAGEIATYGDWNTKLSTKIFMHITHPDEVFRTASGGHSFIFFLYFIVLLVFSYFILFKWLKPFKIETSDRRIGNRILIFFSSLIVGAGILILSLRGGVQQIPVTATDGYYSDNNFINDVSVNPAWNFIHTCYVYFKSDISEYYKTLPVNESEALMKEWYSIEKDTTIKFIEAEAANVILVTLEGWSAQMIGPLGGLPDVTPNFNSLCDEGVLFTKIYSTGGTSETGHSSIISGYPTIAGISISTESAKCRTLPSINQSLEDDGYNSFYTFGGSLSYGNIGGYLRDVGFDELVDENQLDLAPYGKLGYHDEAMFPYFLERIQEAKRPYIYGLFTQSTHSPYDMPAEKFGDYEDDGYITSMHYADEHLGKFVEGVRALPDFDNTIVIFVADHGRPNIVNGNTYKADFFHIPLLFWGGAVADSCRGLRINKIGSQADVAKTLLEQLDQNTAAFHWSKDLMNPYTKEWAISTSTLSYGWIDSAGYTAYHMFNKVILNTPYKDGKATDAALKNCKAVLESMYREFEKM